jgi:murein DD-endopeptidase MepM/ murein hydrolase activator NlpD
MKPPYTLTRLAAEARSLTAGAALLACVAAAGAPAFDLAGPVTQGALVRGTVPAGTVALTLDGKPVPFAGDGRFILGFDRDQPGAAVLEARLADGGTARRRLDVAVRQWRIEHVRIARRPTASTAEFLRIRERELARIAAARALGPKSEGWRQRFVWPATGRISGVFGSQRIYRGTPGSYHSGVDVAAGAGAAVVAPADGVVVLAGPPAFSLEGNLVIIAHGMGLSSAFLHLAGTAVREGEAVRQGQRIGTVGSTGRATGPHLHWSMKWNEARIDPQLLVAAKRE